MQKVMLSAKILAAATIGLSVLTFASTASATSLVPNIEGEIKTTNLGCLSNATCIDTTNAAQSPFTYKVTSLDVDGSGTKFGKSLLFVDNRDTANTNYGLGITFGTQDAGTNPPGGEYWLRAVATNASGNPVENGQLEIGQFFFDFLGKEVDSLTLELFDVEDKDITKILTVNGAAPNPSIIAAEGLNGNTQRITIKNVQNFQIQLGNPNSTKFPNTGDGVAMRSVPEPATVISLGALAVAGMFGTRQRRKIGV
ncbi:hypothetical protein DSM106972_068750 [Dulcicalothrix desertica PCC 7102]|uniref:Ice-binding protein C-terminal domain-containing protein n=1 Tax=Dulcicalothrix desertica PCC 7102 TaxID=232991 RepID=A0A3S1AI66_9CYAN|nr:LEVG family PEP-CTERM protein [Dulcicalothrix desertica]RUT01324.1 hypothetical protein DSM106972_068750 [Dulcicalothrix desertica PCC 7102]TWH40527.1 putative secreted protein with PEP-CTERM sorting signal [Dulcicalothrix desertica PCC 7102]